MLKHNLYYFVVVPGAHRDPSRRTKPNKHIEKDIPCYQQTKMPSTCVHTPFFVLFLRPISGISVGLVKFELEYTAGQTWRQRCTSWRHHIWVIKEVAIRLKVCNSFYYFWKLPTMFLCSGRNRTGSKML